MAIQGGTTTAEQTSSILNIPEQARCLGCGYQLRGLDRPRCPECGREFDPVNCQTMRLPLSVSERLARHPQILQVYIPLAAWAVGSTLIALALAPRNLGLFVSLPVTLIIGEWFRIATHRLLTQRFGSAARSSRRWLYRLAPFLVLAWIFVGVAYHRCDYSTTVGLKFVGIAYSERTGPCRKGIDWSYRWHLFGPWYMWVRNPTWRDLDP